MKRSMTYFEEPGPQNTEAVVAVVKERIAEGDIQSVVVASESGSTALALAEALKDTGVRVICVAPYGGYQHVLKRTWPPMKEAIRGKLDCLGVKVLTETPWIDRFGLQIVDRNFLRMQFGYIWTDNLI